MKFPQFGSAGRSRKQSRDTGHPTDQAGPGGTSLIPGGAAPRGTDMIPHNAQSPRFFPKPGAAEDAFRRMEMANAELARKLRGGD